MLFECLIQGDKFIIARQAGWKWSDRERAEFEITPVDIDPEPAEDAEIAITETVHVTLSQILGHEIGVMPDGDD